MRLTDSPAWRRWQRLPPRDRLALGLLAAFLVALLFYLWLWLPAQRHAADAREHYQAQRELYAYLQQNSELARQMGRSDRVALAPEELQGLVTQSAQQSNLRIESFDSGADGGLQVSLPGASYTLLLRWLAELQALGVNVGEVSLERAGEGQVDARVGLRAGS
ncbi:general secretion pathway protein M [Stutzerimonas degradans]|nr:general secretion pathway protein M [Stutzerimonas degradans]